MELTKKDSLEAECLNPELLILFPQSLNLRKPSKLKSEIPKSLNLEFRLPDRSSILFSGG